MNKVELLSPAGSLKKLEYALEYGADAVYIGLKGFSLRSAGLTLDEIEEAVRLTKQKNKKIYVALNIFAQNDDIYELQKVFASLDKIKPDVLIIADPGVFEIAKEITSLPVHISTQANVTNYKSVSFWKKLGAKRITLARELSLEEITRINKETDIETEVFIHGAMCLSYSGRCYLSKYLDGRNANKGDCAQPCRWNYYIQEEKSSEVFQVETNERGSYILSSKDLCLINHVPALIKAGISSFKIEGRMKSIYYVSAVTKIYREAIDSYYNDPNGYKIDENWLDELNKVSHRPYSAGFINQMTSDPAFGNAYSEASRWQGTVDGDQSYMSDAEFVGEVTDRKNGFVEIAVRNKLLSGEQLDVLTPSGDNFKWKINDMKDIKTGEQVDVAHANYTVISKGELQKYSLLRRTNDK